MHRLVLVNVDVDHLARDARGDRHNIRCDLRVIGRLFSGGDDSVDSVEDEQHHDGYGDDEVDPLRAALLDHRLVLGDVRRCRDRCRRRDCCLFALHLHLHVNVRLF